MTVRDIVCEMAAESGRERATRSVSSSSCHRDCRLVTETMRVCTAQAVVLPAAVETDSGSSIGVYFASRRTFGECQVVTVVFVMKTSVSMTVLVSKPVDIFVILR